MRMTPALRTLFERDRRRAGTLATKDFLKLIKDAADKQTRWTAVAGSQDLADCIEMLRCSVRGEYQDLSKTTIGIAGGHPALCRGAVGFAARSPAWRGLYR